jgi:hypothetical protein
MEADESETLKSAPLSSAALHYAVPGEPSRFRDPGADPLFDEFWSVYPRKTGKGMARREWHKLSLRRVGVDPQRVIEAARQFRDECRAKGTDARYIPHPGTWIRDGRYEDETDPAGDAPLAPAPPPKREWQGDERLLATVIRLADPERPVTSAEAIVRAIRAQFPAGVPEGFPAVSAERGAELAGMRYADYLLSPEWQERRKAMLRAAGYLCMTCNADDTLDVHHRTYERRGREHPADLIVLCHDCHMLFHSHRRLQSPPADGDGRAETCSPPPSGSEIR